MHAGLMCPCLCKCTLSCPIVRVALAVFMWSGLVIDGIGSRYAGVANLS